MEIVGIIAIPLVVAFIGIYWTNHHTTKMGKQTAESITESTNRMIQAAREDGVNCVDKGIKALAEETKTDAEEVMKLIQANGEQTLKAIEQDGFETRHAIRDVHKSIKDEIEK